MTRIITNHIFPEISIASSRDLTTREISHPQCKPMKTQNLISKVHPHKHASSNALANHNRQDSHFVGRVNSASRGQPNMLYQETNVQNVINVLEAKGAEGMIQPAFECISLLGSLSKHAPENKTKTTPVQCFCFLTWAVYLKIYNSKGKGESIHFLPAS